MFDTIVNFIVLSVIKSLVESFIVELKKILATPAPAPKKPDPAHHIVGMFINTLFSEIFNKKSQPDGQGISGVYTMNDLEHVPTQVLYCARHLKWQKRMNILKMPKNLKQSWINEAQPINQ